jgi:uncharacterized membrane protein YdjX (TVP38/TMEM64 family)
MRTIEGDSPTDASSKNAEAETSADPSPQATAARVGRIVAIVVLLSLVIAAAAVLFLTPRGQILLHNPRQLRGDVGRLVSHHPIGAIFFYGFVYISLGVLALPLWWLQILAGMAFGLPLGVAYTQIASTAGAVLAARFSHWLAADWFHRLEKSLTRLQSLDETFGRNGLLVVMAVRLCHVLPFGLSNYAFGLTTMQTRDIALGTLLGNLPAVCVYVAIGTGGHPLSDWRYVAGIVVLNILLVLPLAVHYLVAKR